MSEAKDNLIPPSKPLPVMTSHVAKMLGLPLSGSHLGESSLPVAKAQGLDTHFSQIVGNLYVKDGQSPTDDHSHTTEHSNNHKPDAVLPSDNAFLKAAKTIAPYVIVFSVSIFLYFFFFGQVNFGSWFPSKTQVQTPKQSEVAQLEQQNSGAYQKWINQFYFDVSDPKILDPEADNSGNGLTNFQKYLLNLNPKSYDTLGLGMPDSQALEQGINPLSGGKLTEAQQAIVDKYFDFEVISNRLALAHLQQSGQVAGAETGSGNPLAVNSFPLSGGNNQQSAVLGTLPGVNVEVNTSVPGRLQIPSLKVDAPLTWTQDTANFDKDLQNGVVHYPGTALPGQIGTTYISGHSSNYVWAKGSYNHVFTQLGNLADNTSFQITVQDKNGKTVIFHYVVVGRQQYSPTDQAQFQNTGKSLVALSTCWPVGSTAKRLVVFGQLTQVEQ